MRHPGTLAFVTVTLAACNAEPFFPSADNMQGNYIAYRLVKSDTSGITDLLAGGAFLTLNLARDGTTSGRLYVPGGATGAGVLDADMAGNWLMVAGKISLGQNADTFVRYLDYIPSRDRLSADQALLDGTRMVVVLRKSTP